MRSNTVGLRTSSSTDFSFNYTYNICRRTRRKPCPNSALPTTNPAWTDLVFNSGIPRLGRRLTAPAVSLYTAMFSKNFEVQLLLFLLFLYHLISSFFFLFFLHLSKRTCKIILSLFNPCYKNFVIGLIIYNGRYFVDFVDA